jgi:alpha-galactosidase
LWFEFEVVGKESRLFESSDILLQRDGFPIQDGNRKFLDLRMKENRDYLQKRMFDLIAECGIGYIKVDYNGNTGGDIDGAKSSGENLADHMSQVIDIFKEFKVQFPDLVLENCASGGQRLTPAYGALADMHSFSDAHTCVDIPVIAANVLSQIPAHQSQIWAVLSSEESLQRISYSLSATFLGRMCLSGDIHNLNDKAWRLTRDAMDFYRQVWPIIKDGRSRRYGLWSPTMRKLRGWQAVVREGENGEQLIVVHTFGDTPEQIEVPLLEGFSVKSCFGYDRSAITIENGALTLRSVEEWSGAVFWLEKSILR